MTSYVIFTNHITGDLFCIMYVIRYCWNAAVRWSRLELKALSVERIKIAKYGRIRISTCKIFFSRIVEFLTYLVRNKRKRNKCLSTVFDIKECRNAIRCKMYVPLTTPHKYCTLFWTVSKVSKKFYEFFAEFKICSNYLG